MKDKIKQFVDRVEHSSCLSIASVMIDVQGVMRNDAQIKFVPVRVHYINIIP